MLAVKSSHGTITIVHMKLRKADGIRCVSTLAALADTKPDVLVLCNPLKAMPQILGALKPLIDTDITTLTDVGSVKAMVREQVKAVGLEHCYVGAHPMAGNELSGWESSDPTLYDGALWAITVDENTEYQRFRAVATMIVDHCSNRLIVLDDATHDRCAALISHMPHVISTAMINELVANPNRNIAAALAAGSWLGHDSCCADRSKPYPCNGGRGTPPMSKRCCVILANRFDAYGQRAARHDHATGLAHCR